MSVEVLEKVGFAERDGFSHSGFHPPPALVETTVVITGSEGGGYMPYWDPVYATSHDSPIAKYAYTSFTYAQLAVGQRWTAYWKHTIWRAGLYFDTSGIPVGATIKSAKLTLVGNGDGSDTEFTVVVVDGTDLADGGLVVADYGDLLDDIASLGSLASSAFVDEGDNEITLNVSAINAGGVTKLGMRSSRDINSNPPSGHEWVGFYTSKTANGVKRPVLEVVYES